MKKDTVTEPVKKTGKPGKKPVKVLKKKEVSAVASASPVFIDMGYLLFYRYHATKKNIGFRNMLSNGIEGDVKHVGVGEESQDIEKQVLSMYEDHLRKQLEQLIKKKYKDAVVQNRFYFCNDSRHKDLWRTQIYPEYKDGRATAPGVIHEVFEIMMRVCRSYEKNGEGVILSVNGLEADDIVYLTIEELRKEGIVNDQTPAIIMATDRDYLQIPHTILVDAAGKRVGGNDSNGETCTAEEHLMIKVLMGDKSDNIPPIMKGVGKKTAEKLAKNPDELEKFLEKKGPVAREGLERNRQLICMDRIPEGLVKEYKKVWFLSNNK
jgi:5'-3' exonuclease